MNVRILVLCLKWDFNYELLIMSFIISFYIASLFIPTFSHKIWLGDRCTVDEQSGVCSKLMNCQYWLDEIKQWNSNLPRSLRQRLQKANCGYGHNDPHVCCPSNLIYNNGNDLDQKYSDIDGESNWNSVNDGGNSETTTRGYNIDTNNKIDYRHRNLHLLPTNCGIFEDNRIIGGNRTALFEMPWMVLISYDSVRGEKLNCGGTLITKWYMLTAAHCVSHLTSSLRVSGGILGEHDLRTDPDCEDYGGGKDCAPPVQNVKFDRIIPHPKYTSQGVEYDIALVRLSEPANFNLDSIKPICLPTTRELQNEDLVGAVGTVLGWGTTERGLQSHVLLRVNLPIVSKSVCQKAYSTSVTIQDSHLCAGGIANKDSCAGDSGGPLMYQGRGPSGGIRYIQRGIVSFGTKQCGLLGRPDVYTRVSHYMDWILDNFED